jgi:hypothetical protein
MASLSSLSRDARGPARRLRDPRRDAGRGALAAAVLLTAALAACAPPSERAAAPPAALYVADSVAGTVAQLDAGTGRPLGPPLPAGPLLWHLARGPDSSLLALSAAPGAARPLTHLARAGDGTGWVARPVALPGPAREGRLAGDGGRFAVVVDRMPEATAPGAPSLEPGAAPPPRCRLTLVDVPAGSVAATAAVCGPHEQVTGLALDDGPAGPVAYLALWRASPEGPGGGPAGAGGGAAGGHRVVAVHAPTGTVAAAIGLDGVPALVALGPAPGRPDRRLYAVERLSGPEDEPPAPVRARLLGLHPATLEVESARPLGFVPTRLVVAPDGEVAYALHDRTLTRLGPAGGPDRSVALPERGLALAVGRERVYVSSAYGREVWALRRRDGRLVATLRAGRSPADLLVSPAP